MGSVDLPLEKLVDYKPDSTAKDDFEAFWCGNKAESRKVPLNATFDRIEGSLPNAEVYDAAFDGVDGVRVRGWFITPKDPKRPLPAVVQFIGYTGGRDYPHALSAHVLNGFCGFIMDSRGQGGGTGQVMSTSHGAQRGFITHGILDKDEYYYRNFYLDTIRAVQAVADRDEVDGSRIAAIGGSQGGALAIACAALSEQVKAMAPDVPWLSHFRRAVDVAVGPYEEITDFLKKHPDQIEKAFDTLSYFDIMNLVEMVKVTHAYYSVGLWDDICPPSTVYASYNRLPESVDKSIEVYPYNKHEGGHNLHQSRKLFWLREILG
ncbi:MAG: acetylxylan esterase [Gemmatimonadetes bacterium]|nr:acetylxylan esterase [Gemmatimonadota bacterium]